MVSLWFAVLGGGGCASAPRQAAGERVAVAEMAPAEPTVEPMPHSDPRKARGQRVSEAPATVIDARPAALVNGRRVSWGDLRPILTEAAGAQALQELTLDALLVEAISERNLEITPDHLAGERRLMLETLSRDPNTAIRLLDELRARQGLGRHRFDALLRRNASLRMLVRDQVEVTSEAVETMYEIVHGPRRQARLIVTSNLRDADRAIERIQTGEFFGDVAVDISTDASASRGGLLEPISRADPAYPEAMREALWALRVGEVGPPILLDDQYAVIKLVNTFAGEPVDPASVRADLERQVRLNQERILMDRLARRMLAGSSFTIFDESLRETWERRRRVD